MNGILIFIAIVVISSTIGAVSRWLKNQQQEEQARLARERSGTRAARPETGTDTIDRYVAEIERLRQRKAGAAARDTASAAKPVVRKARVADAPPVVKPAQRAKPVALRVEDLPVAPVVARPAPPPVVTPGGSLFPQGGGDLTARPEIAAEKLTQVPPFLALLSSPKGLATAMAISIVLGPPRCKQHHV